ncbi:MAG: hypothetical protein QOH71_4176 [Blastocatellia bacterium]|nr:hypothetical protein [Blastocatellia bacterium]
MNRLSEAGNNPSLLGSALVSIHGALEDYIRGKLANNSRLSSAQRTSATDKQKTQWMQLLDWTEQYDGLAAIDRQRILRFNGMRQRFAHGEEFTGTRREIEEYAVFVQNFVVGDEIGMRTSEQMGQLSGPMPHVLCPCGTKCRGASQYSGPPECYQSYSGDSMPHSFRRREMAKEKGLGGKIAIGLLMGVFEGMMSPKYEAYQCAVCGCEVLFASYQSTYGLNRKRVGDTCSC